jgi:phosphosulfolactate phosphohydrolase-like enzyme
VEVNRVVPSSPEGGMTRRLVTIDALPDGAWRHAGYDAIVVVDVLLSATTLVTAIAQGRRVLVAGDDGQAARLQAGVRNAMLLTDALESPDDAVRFAGPALLARESREARPVVHVSALAGMMAGVPSGARVYVACVRNLDATANELARWHQHVAILGAGDRGEVCSEDQMTAAWLAVRLRQRGFALEDRNTVAEVQRWGGFDPSLIGLSRSAERLRTRGRGAEVDFVLGHVDDLDLVCSCTGQEISGRAAEHRRPRAEASSLVPGIEASATGH